MTPVKEWTFDPSEILQSPRKVRGKFHTPMVDKDQEYIEGKAVRNAVPDFMHLPILHDFHKERTVGIVTRVVELPDGSFDFEGLIKATDDCNDIWELITKGNYDQVSLYGKRLCGSDACKMKPGQRSQPCVTTAVRLDSISVCDDNARNEGTHLVVAKGAKVVFTATDDIIKATTTDNPMSHSVTDYPKQKFGKDGLPRAKKKASANCPLYAHPDPYGSDERKGDDMDDDVDKAEQRIPVKKPSEPGTRPAYPEKDKKSTEWKAEPEEETEPVEAPEQPEAGESDVEEKLEWLEQAVDELVARDEEGKAGKEPVATEIGQEYELPPEQEENYGAPTPGEGREESEVQPEDNGSEIDHMAAKIHLSKKVSEEKANLEEEKAKGLDHYINTGTQPQRLGVNASPAEVEHTANLYREGKKRLEDQKLATKQSFLDDKEKPRADAATVDAKARDPARGEEPEWKQKQQESKKKWTSEQGKKIKEKPRGGANPNFQRDPEAQAEANKVMEQHKPWKDTSLVHGKPGRSVAEGPRAGGKPIESTASIPKKDTEYAPNEHPKTGRYDVGEHKDNPQSRMTGHSNKPSGGNTFRDTGSSGDYGKDYSNEGMQDNRTGSEEKATDVNSRIDRLIAKVQKLMQTDEAVHEQMSVEPKCGCEKKADDISKAIGSTETMKDEDVDLLVKAKVEAQVSEIIKAQTAKYDELKKAFDDMKAKVEKMENETITKSGAVAILREGDENIGEAFLTNAGAITAARKKATAKV